MIGVLLGFFILLGPHTVHATELGASYYFPGISATFAPGVAPHAGTMFVEQMLYQAGRADTAVQGGRIQTNIRTDVFLNVIGFTNTVEKSSLGGNPLQLGVFVPVGSVSLNSTISTNHGSQSVSDSTTSIGDSTLVGSLFWKKGDMHYKVTQSVFVPTGAYTMHNLSNVGRNYWGFDTTFAMTHLNLKSGVEFSLAPGIMFNTKNEATDYQSGTEFHVEFALNKHYFKQHYAIGLQGYYYRQISGDSGSGARLGSFNGEAFGIGPAVMWTPPAGKGKVVVIAKWLFDLHHEKRLHGNYGQLMIGYKF
jgi:hypothetical protein